MKKLSPLLVFFGIVVLFVIVYREVNKVPLIYDIYPQTVQAGEIVQIRGKNFGTSLGKVFLSDYRVSRKDIIFWSRKEIHIKISENTTSSFLSVKTSVKTSNRMLLIVEDELPYIRNIPSIASRVPSIFPSQVGIGELLTIREMRVTSGENVKDIRVPMEGGMQKLKNMYYVLSTPQELVIQVPDGMQSGMIRVQISQEEIMLGPITVITKGASRQREEFRRYVVAQSVTAGDEGPHYFRIHSPDKKFSQPLVRILQEDEVWLLNSSVGLVTDSRKLRRVFEIFRYQERIDFSEDFARTEEQYAPLFIQEYLIPSAFMPSHDPAIIQFSSVKSESGDLRTARLLYEAVVTRLTPDAASLPQAVTEAALTAFDTGEATSFGFASLLGTLLRSQGIPSRIVRGYRVGAESFTPHYWVEFFLHGFGWVPCDPYLEALEEHSTFHYFAQLDAQRFSLTSLPPLFYTFSPESRFMAGTYPHSSDSPSFQEVWLLLRED